MMDDKRMMKRIKDWKPLKKRAKGIPSKILYEMKITKMTNQMKIARNREVWDKIVKTVAELPEDGEEFWP